MLLAAIQPVVVESVSLSTNKVSFGLSYFFFLPLGKGANPLRPYYYLGLPHSREENRILTRGCPMSIYRIQYTVEYIAVVVAKYIIVEYAIELGT